MNAAREPTDFELETARIISEHQAGIWRYLRALGCDSALAEDLTQETFLAILQRPFRDLGEAATATYLRRTAHNLFISHCRRMGRVQSVADIDGLNRDWTKWAGQDNGEDLLGALRECLAGLGDRDRRALDRRFRDRWSRTQIAADLELTEDGAKNLLQRAKQKLRECIESKLK